MTKIGNFCKKFGSIMLLTFKNPSQAWAELCTLFRPIKNSLKHVWVCMKVFGSDMKMGTKLAVRKLKGYELTRRENKRLSQAFADLIKMVPFSLFIIVPFLEFTLPFFLIV